MKILTVISQKGGVGKTTIATALAVAARQDGKQVAVFDLDPQASACFWNDRRKAAGHDQTMPIRDVSETRIPHLLEAMRQDGADLVIIDCPPSHRYFAEALIGPADMVLIPTRPEMLDIRAMGLTVKQAQELRKQPHVVLTFCPPAGAEIEQARQVVKQLGAEIAPVTIGARKAYSRAQQDGLTAQEAEPGSKAAGELKSLYEYMNITLYGAQHGKAKAKSQRRV